MALSFIIFVLLYFGNSSVLFVNVSSTFQDGGRMVSEIDSVCGFCGGMRLNANNFVSIGGPVLEIIIM